MPMKTKLRLTACNISLIRIACCSSSLVCVARVAVQIITYEYSIVIIGRFINHLSTHKFIKHIFINTTSKQQIRKSLLILSFFCGSLKGLCSFQWLVKLLPDRHHSKAFLPPVHNPCCKIYEQNLLHLRLSVRTDDTKDDLWLLPLQAVKPLILWTGTLNFFTLAYKKRGKVCSPCLFSLFFCKMNVCWYCYHFLSFNIFFFSAVIS